MITFIIDEITPCLKDVETGNYLDTEVIPMTNKKELSKYNSRNGWYVNWGKFSEEVEIYGVVLKGSRELQGLIALENKPDAYAVHIQWACTAPHNNVFKTGKKKYSGVGGHLFAIAGNKSIEYGYGGYVYGEASNKKVLQHYMDNYDAEKFDFGTPHHEYRFIVDEDNMKGIIEEYDYEDNGEQN